MSVKEVIMHENYNHGRQIPENDIAMIVLKSPVKNTPISLPSKGECLFTSYDVL